MGPGRSSKARRKESGGRVLRPCPRGGTARDRGLGGVAMPAAPTRTPPRPATDVDPLTARNRTVECHLSLAVAVARRYRGRGIPLEDLVQVASVGLIKAVDRCDATRNVEFATFAVPTIAGEIKRNSRDQGGRPNGSLGVSRTPGSGSN